MGRSGAGAALMGPAIMRRSGAGERLLQVEYERGRGTLGRDGSHL